MGHRKSQIGPGILRLGGKGTFDVAFCDAVVQSTDENAFFGSFGSHFAEIIFIFLAAHFALKLHFLVELEVI